MGAYCLLKVSPATSGNLELSRELEFIKMGMPGSDVIYMDSSYNLFYPKGANQLFDIPEEVMPVINQHWAQFPPQHPLIPHIFGILFFFLWMVNFVGNGLVIFIFLKTKSLRTPTNMFVVNLALSDCIMMSTMGVPVTINAFTQRYWMWGVFGCQLYAFVGAVCGTCSILTMVVIGYDRYNVIVKGFNGVKITGGKAFVLLTLIWGYSIVVSMMPFFGWGGYMAEGLLVTCGYDYLSQDMNRKSYMMFAFGFNYLAPITMICFFYSKIVKAVVMHEAALKAQAKKMNVDSLRSNTDDNKDSAEVRIAKVAITNVLLWLCTWSPYAIVNFIAVFGNQALVTPLVSQIPSFAAKTASCLNPLVYAISHPRYREALSKEVPCLGIKNERAAAAAASGGTDSVQTKA